jgi:hypothetical protein
MKVLYDDKLNIYKVRLKDSETLVLINTSDIVEAKKRFLNYMSTLFDNAVCEQLKDSF